MSELIIRISGDVKNYEEALKKAQEETEGFTGATKEIATKAAEAFAVLSAEMLYAVHIYAQNEQATIKLTGALQSTGLASDELVDKYKAQAEAAERLSGASEDQVLKGQAVLQGMIGQIEISDALTKAVVDLSARTGIDLVSAYDLVGKAVNGHDRGLKALGITIDLTQSQSGRLDDITKKLTQTFGGSAEAAAQGTGSFKLLFAQFEQIERHIGAALAPALISLTKGLSSVFTFIADNKEITNFAAALLAAGAAVSFLAAAGGGAVIALGSLKAALAAMQVQTTLTSLALKGLVGATGIGLLIIVAVEVYEHWGTIWPRMQAIFSSFASNTSSIMAAFGKTFSSAFHFNLDGIKQGMADLKAALSKGFDDANKTTEIKPQIIQNPDQKALADKAQAIRKANDDALIAETKATNEVLKLEAQHGSSELIAIRKQEAQLLGQFRQTTNAEERAAIQEKLADQTVLEAQARKDSLDKTKSFNEEILKDNEFYQALSQEQKKAYLIKNQQLEEAALDNQNQAEQKAAAERVKIQTKNHNDFLLNQVKFGTAYAKINAVMHSAIVEGSAKAFGDLAALQTSSNSTLKGIGKAAAVANVIIKTAESAMNIYAGFSLIPFVGPALGVIGAAAAVAFGAEQIGAIQSAADGGLLQGGTPGIDSIPVMGMQGELVVPKRNFDEVVNAVANQRSGNSPQGSGGGGSINEIVLSLKGDLVKFIEVEIIKRQRQGISTITAALA